MTWLCYLNGTSTPMSDVKIHCDIAQLNSAQVLFPGFVDIENEDLVELYYAGELAFEGYVTQMKKHANGKYTDAECIELAWELERRVAMPGYKQKMEVTITCIKSAKNYVVPLVVPWKTGMAVNFTDLLFTDSDFKQCFHWVESYVSGVSASVYVLVPELPYSITLWCFFEPKISFGDASSGAKTFPLFIDCETGVPDDFFKLFGGIPATAEFVSPGYQGTKCLHIYNDPAVPRTGWDIKGSYGVNVIVEAMCKASGVGPKIGALIGRHEKYGMTIDYYSVFPDVSGVYKTDFWGSSQLCSSTPKDLTSWKRWGLAFEGSLIIGLHEDGGICWANDEDFDAGYAGFLIEGGCEMWLDVIRVRPYMYPEPGSVFGVPESAEGTAVSMYAVFEDSLASTIVTAVLTGTGWSLGSDFEDDVIDEFTIADDTVLDILTKLARSYMEKEIWFGPGKKVNIGWARSAEALEVKELQVVADVIDGRTRCDGVIVRGAEGASGSAGDLTGLCTLIKDWNIKTSQDATALAQRELALRKEPYLSLEATTIPRTLKEAQRVDVPGHSLMRIKGSEIGLGGVRLQLV